MNKIQTVKDLKKSLESFDDDLKIIYSLYASKNSFEYVKETPEIRYIDKESGRFSLTIIDKYGEQEKVIENPQRYIKILLIN